MVNIYPTRGQILRGGHPKLFGVIRGNSAANERIFTKVGVHMDNGTQKAALWSTCTPCEIQNRGNTPNIFRLYRNNSAENRLIFTERGTYAGNLIQDVAQCSECTRASHFQFASYAYAM